MSSVKELEEKVKELMKEIETLKQKEKAEEFEYPFEEDEPYWVVKEQGYVQLLIWDTENYDQPRYEQGHIFKTQQEAERECDKRALLTRFRQFRDKCNGEWKPDFTNLLQGKHNIQFSYAISELVVYNSRDMDGFRLFGYFKELKDAERAIELFGDEIKRLFVEVA